jgi:hypothetical protein
MRGIKAMLWEASVLDPNEVNFSIGGSLFFADRFFYRVFASMASQSQIVRGFSLQHQVGRK